MTFEDVLRQDMRDKIEELQSEDFVKEYNKMFGTDLTVDDVIWKEK